jgi:hypothetical protein
MGAGVIDPQPESVKRPAWRDLPATDRQLALLERLPGGPTDPGITRGAASDRIEALGGQLSNTTVQAVRCSECGAAPGLSCQRASGSLRSPHRRRLTAARKGASA